MLTYSKRVFEFSLQYKEEKFSVTYTKEWFRDSEMECGFEVIGNVNLVKEAEEFLYENEFGIAEKLEEDLELESIDWKEF